MCTYIYILYIMNAIISQRNSYTFNRVNYTFVTFSFVQILLKLQKLHQIQLNSNKINSNYIRNYLH